MRTLLCALTIVCASIACADAQPLCERPVKLIVPVQAGSSGDAFARILADALQKESGLNVYILNMPGPGAWPGTRAAKELAESQPDGCTLMVAINSNIGGGLELMRMPPYDPIKDFSLLGLVGRSPVVLLTNVQYTGLTTAANLAVYGADAKKGLFFPRMNAISQISSLQFATIAGFTAIDVPFPGESDGISALLRGDVQFAFVVGSNAKQWLSHKEIRGIALSGPTGKKFFPELPTLSEAGFPTFQEITPIYAMVGPKGMPEHKIRAYVELLQKVLAGDELQQKLRSIAVEPVRPSPKELEAFIYADRLLWKGIIERNGIPKN